MTLILCGLPGSGKSTVGQELAKRLSCPYIDTDQLIEKAFRGRFSCRQLYQKYGERFFREIESETVQNLRIDLFSIVATGGGTLCQKENTRHLKTLGKLVYLKADWEFLFSRAIEKGCPAYLNASSPKMAYKTLFEKRIHVFENADFSIDIQKHSLEDIIHNLLICMSGFSAVKSAHCLILGQNSGK